MGKVMSSRFSFVNLRALCGFNKALTTKDTKVHEGNLRMQDYIHALGMRQPARLMTLSQPTNQTCRQIDPFPIEYRFDFRSLCARSCQSRVVCSEAGPSFPAGSDLLSRLSSTRVSWRFLTRLHSS